MGGSSDKNKKDITMGGGDGTFLAPWRLSVRSFFFPKTHEAMKRAAAASEASPRTPAVSPTTANAEGGGNSSTTASSSSSTNFSSTRRWDWFDVVMLVVVAASMVTLASISPRWVHASMSGGEASRRALVIAETVMVVFFALEIAINCVAFGFNSVLVGLFPTIDTIIVAACVVSVVLEFFGEKNYVFCVAVIRSMRLLPALAALFNNPFLASIVRALYRVINGLLDVTLLLVLFLTLFSVTGVFLFGDDFTRRCVHEAALNSTTRGEFATFFYDSLPNAASKRTIEILSRESVWYPQVTAAGATTPAWPPPPSSSSSSKVNDDEFLTGLFICGGYFDNAFPQLVVEISEDNVTLARANITTAALLRFTENIYAPRSPRPNDDAMESHDACVAAEAGVASLSCSTTQLCRPHDDNTGYQCPHGFTCATVRNPYFGYVGFSNFLVSYLSSFTSMTQTLWYEVSYMGTSATNASAVAFIGAMLIVLGILLTNLFIVLVTAEFEKAQREDAPERTVWNKTVMEKKAKKRDKKKAKRSGLAIEMAIEAAHTSEAAPSPPAAPADPLQQDSNDGKENSNNDDGKGPCSCIAAAWGHVQNTVTRYVTHRRWFRVVSTTSIILNVVLLACYFDGLPEKGHAVFEWLNLLFLSWFTLEVGLWMIGKGGKFFKHPLNIIDFAAVAVSWAGRIAYGAESSYRWVQLFRILRIVSLFKIFPQLYYWMLFVLESLSRSPIVLILAVFSTIVFAILGMQIFGGSFCVMATRADLIASPFLVDNTNPACPYRPRSNFDSFSQAILTSCQVVTGDSWNLVMYNAMRARGDYFSALFMLYFFVGNLVMVSILVGVMLSGHDGQLLMDGAGGKESSEERRRGGRRIKGGGGLSPSRDFSGVDAYHFLKMGSLGEGTLTETKLSAVVKQMSLTLENELLVAEEFDDRDDVNDDLHQPLPSRDGAINGDGPSPATPTAAPTFGGSFEESSASFLLEREVSFIVPKSIARRIIDSSILTVVNVCVTVCSAIFIGLRDPIAAPDVTRSRILDAADIAVATYFFLESITAMVAYRGCWQFLRRSSWNIVEFALMVLAIVSVPFYFFQYDRIFHSVFAIQIVRPLTLCKRSKGMRHVLNALGKAAVTLRSVIATILIIYVIFAVMGVQLLSGKLKRCVPPPDMESGFIIDLHSDDGSREVPFWMLNRVNCTAAGGLWSSHEPSFDNVFSGLMHVFLLSTLDMWSNWMYRAMDFNGFDEAPTTDANARICIFFVGVVAIGGFLVSAIFTTVLSDAYNREIQSAMLRRSRYAEREYSGWMLTNQRLVRCLPHGTKQKKGRKRWMSWRKNSRLVALRTAVRSISRSEKFALLCFGFVLLNFAVALSAHYPASKQFEKFLSISNIAFSCIFAVEAAFKLFGDGFRVYFASNWNRIDFFVAVASVAGLLAVSDARLSASIGTIRLLRVGRILKGVSRVNTLLRNFATALISLGPAAAVVFTFYFMFAAVGMRLFGTIRQTSFNVDGVNHAINFGTLGGALNLLLRLSTNHWWVIYKACSGRPPNCDANLGECGPATPVPELYFIGFIVLSSYVMKNLLVAVLLDSFGRAADQLGMTKSQAVEFFAEWKKAGCRGEYNESVPVWDVIGFIRSLPASCPLSLSKLPPRRRVAAELRLLTLLQVHRIAKRHVNFKSVVDVLCYLTYRCAPPETRPFVHDIMRQVEEEKRSIEAECAAADGAVTADQWDTIASTVETEDRDEMCTARRNAAALLMIFNCLKRRPGMMEAEEEEEKKNPVSAILMEKFGEGGDSDVAEEDEGSGGDLMPRDEEDVTDILLTSPASVQ